MVKGTQKGASHCGVDGADDKNGAGCHDGSNQRDKRLALAMRDNLRRRKMRKRLVDQNDE